MTTTTKTGCDSGDAYQCSQTWEAAKTANDGDTAATCAALQTYATCILNVRCCSNTGSKLGMENTLSQYTSTCTGNDAVTSPCTWSSGRCRTKRPSLPDCGHSCKGKNMQVKAVQLVLRVLRSKPHLYGDYIELLIWIPSNQPVSCMFCHKGFERRTYDFYSSNLGVRIRAPPNPAGKLNHVTSDQAKQFYGKNYSYVQAEGKAGIEVRMQKIVSRDHGSLRIIKDLIFIRPQMTWHWRAWWSPRGCERNPFCEAEKHTHRYQWRFVWHANLQHWWFLMITMIFLHPLQLLRHQKTNAFWVFESESPIDLFDFLFFLSTFVCFPIRNSHLFRC